MCVHTAPHSCTTQTPHTVCMYVHPFRDKLHYIVPLQAIAAPGTETDDFFERERLITEIMAQHHSTMTATMMVTHTHTFTRQQRVPALM